MKKIVALLLCVILACAFFCGCGGKNTETAESDKKNVLTPYCLLTPTDDYEGQTLSEFMSFAKQREILDYNLDNGMVTSLNGIDNAADYSSCWMLYTDDAANSNDAWGTVEYNGKTYASASFGATELVIAKGCVYIWVYTAF